MRPSDQLAALILSALQWGVWSFYIWLALYLIPDAIALLWTHRHDTYESHMDELRRAYGYDQPEDKSL